MKKKPPKARNSERTERKIQNSRRRKPKTVNPKLVGPGEPFILPSSYSPASPTPDIAVKATIDFAIKKSRGSTPRSE